MKLLKMVPLFLAGMLCLTGCSGKKAKEITVDVAALASSLNDTVTDDQLAETQAAMIPVIYLIDEGLVKNAAGYASSGATACEVAVIECGSADDAKKVSEAFNKRVSSQSDLYASYNTAEVDRLKKAIIDTEGNYAVYCVTNDVSAAEKTLKDAGF